MLLDHPSDEPTAIRTQSSFLTHRRHPEERALARLEGCVAHYALLQT